MCKVKIDHIIGIFSVGHLFVHTCTLNKYGFNAQLISVINLYYFINRHFPSV